MVKEVAAEAECFWGPTPHAAATDFIILQLPIVIVMCSDRRKMLIQPLQEVVCKCGKVWGLTPHSAMWNTRCCLVFPLLGYGADMVSSTQGVARNIDREDATALL
jgi:hypothetical protein